MSFNFPNSPADGTTFAPVGGPTYVYSGGVWKLAGGGSAFVVSSDTAPVSPFPGMLWFETDTGALYFWYVDADSSQWVQINFTPSSGRTAEARNRIVNPAMQISQENDITEAAAHLYYTADQWFGQNSTSGTVLAGRDAVRTPRGSKYRLHSRVTVIDASLAAGDYYIPFNQWIEGIRVADFGWGAAGGVPVVVRFGFRGPAGTYACALRSGVVDASYVHPFTITAGQAGTDIELVFAVPAPTIGTWATDNGRGMIFTICAAAWTTYQAPSTDTWVAGSFFGHASMSNGLAATNLFHFFDAGIYLDPLNTGIAPPFAMPDEAQELLNCQRYWYGVASVASSLGMHYGTAGMTTADAGSFRCPVNMRAIPAVTVGTPTLTNCSALAFVTGGSSGEIESRVTVTAAGSYRAQLQDVALNARM